MTNENKTGSRSSKNKLRGTAGTAARLTREPGAYRSSAVTVSLRERRLTAAQNCGLERHFGISPPAVQKSNCGGFSGFESGFPNCGKSAIEKGLAT